MCLCVSVWVPVCVSVTPRTFRPSLFIYLFLLFPGSRGYIAALGQISALNELGLLSRIKYIGGISGGKTKSIVLYYLQAKRTIIFLCGKS